MTSRNTSSKFSLPSVLAKFEAANEWGQLTKSRFCGLEAKGVICKSGIW